MDNLFKVVFTFYMEFLIMTCLSTVMLVLQNLIYLDLEIHNS